MSQLDIFSLEGRVALIPGGGGGIGSALAEALAGAGARVAVAGRTPESLRRRRRAGAGGRVGGTRGHGRRDRSRRTATGWSPRRSRGSAASTSS